MSADTPARRSTRYHHRIRYFEADQQGVVFNMWYLGYFDEAMSAFLDDGGLAYMDLLSSGFDVQLVHSEIDWSAPLRWPGEVAVDVSLGGAGTTSFELRFEVSTGGEPVATGRTVYVVVGTDGSGKRSIPPHLAVALGVHGGQAAG